MHILENLAENVCNWLNWKALLNELQSPSISKIEETPCNKRILARKSWRHPERGPVTKSINIRMSTLHHNASSSIQGVHRNPPIRSSDMNKHISMKYWTPEWPIMMVDKVADRLHFAELVEKTPIRWPSCIDLSCNDRIHGSTCGELLWELFSNFLATMPTNFSGTFLELFWNFAGALGKGYGLTILEFFWNFFGTI